MTIAKKVEKLNKLLEEKEIKIVDDLIYDIYEDKKGNEIFRVKSKKCFESQKDATNTLNKILSNLISFEK